MNKLLKIQKALIEIPELIFFTDPNFLEYYEPAIVEFQEPIQINYSGSTNTITLKRIIVEQYFLNRVIENCRSKGEKIKISQDYKNSSIEIDLDKLNIIDNCSKDMIFDVLTETPYPSLHFANTIRSLVIGEKRNGNPSILPRIISKGIASVKNSDGRYRMEPKLFLKAIRPEKLTIDNLFSLLEISDQRLSIKEIFENHHREFQNFFIKAMRQNMPFTYAKSLFDIKISQFKAPKYSEQWLNEYYKLFQKHIFVALDKFNDNEISLQLKQENIKKLFEKNSEWIPDSFLMNYFENLPAEEKQKIDEQFLICSGQNLETIKARVLNEETVISNNEGNLLVEIPWRKIIYKNFPLNCSQMQETRKILPYIKKVTLENIKDYHHISFLPDIMEYFSKAAQLLNNQQNTENEVAVYYKDGHLFWTTPIKNNEKEIIDYVNYIISHANINIIKSLDAQQSIILNKLLNIQMHNNVMQNGDYSDDEDNGFKL